MEGSMLSSAEIFSRNLGTVTPTQQQTLQQSRVAVIGCGGLGGYVIEQLVRIGVGQLHLFDPDTFSLSNCNRQLNALTATLDCNKAEVAADRARAIHSYCHVHPFAADFRAVREEESMAVDVAVDCLDDTQARRDLAALCTEKGIPLVHGAVKEWYGQVGVQLPGNDLIARLYPDRMLFQEQEVPSVLSFTVALIASLQAGETVKLLLGLPSPLHNNWMHIDLKHYDFLVPD
jgi:molybdopterin/thiamine biosynthesis adenylyltransferase